MSRPPRWINDGYSVPAGAPLRGVDDHGAFDGRAAGRDGAREQELVALHGHVARRLGELNGRNGSGSTRRWRALGGELEVVDGEGVRVAVGHGNLDRADGRVGDGDLERIS